MQIAGDMDSKLLWIQIGLLLEDIFSQDGQHI